MATQKLEGDVTISGQLQVRGNIIGQNRSGLNQDVLYPFPMELQDFRVWDAFQTPLGSAGSDDLGITAGAFATGCPYITSGDVKAAGAVTRYARTMFTLPAEFDPGQSMTITLRAGMITTIADVSATVDVEVYKSGGNGLISGSDLCTTSALSINSLTFTDAVFTITSTGLIVGDVLDIRVKISTSDSATVTAVIAAIAAAQSDLDIKG